jgi:tryptophanyl-tRNA synthetase
MYPTVLQIQRQFTANAVKNTFGFSMSDSVGKFAFAATQAAPCFISSFPQVLPLASRKVRCLIPCAIDQDPFFILTRNASDALKGLKPALLHTKFLPALRGATAKMSSSSEGDGVILLTDDAKTVRKKMASAFSGGRGTLQELQEKGADLEADVAFTYLSFFLDDDAELAALGEAYRTGKMSSAAVKDRAATCITAHLERFRARRASISDADVQHFGSIRSILPPRPPRPAETS